MVSNFQPKKSVRYGKAMQNDVHSELKNCVITSLVTGWPLHLPNTSKSLVDFCNSAIFSVLMPAG